MDAPCRIEMLGGLKVVYAGRAGEEARNVTRFATHKTAALLAYLAYYFKQPAHPRELLADMLWPESAAEAGRVSLRAALASLRRQLEPPGLPPGSVLIADRFAASLNPLTVATNTSKFEAALKAAPPENNLSLKTSLDRLMLAVNLYTGDLLPGVLRDMDTGGARISPPAAADYLLSEYAGAPAGFRVRAIVFGSCAGRAPGLSAYARQCPSRRPAVPKIGGYSACVGTSRNVGANPVARADAALGAAFGSTGIASSYADSSPSIPARRAVRQL